MNTNKSDNIPDKAVIDVRPYGGTHIARARGLRITASSTSDYKPAAEACASKIYGRDKFILERFGQTNTWLAKPMEATCQK